MNLRCCTATVRRSVPLIPDDEEDNSIQQQLQETRKRSLAELSSILSLLEQKERRASSKKVRTELHKARQRLERYGQIRYGDLLEETYDLPSDRPPLNKDEEEMYGMLERILRRLVQKHQIEEDSPIPINKRSVETIQRTLEQQQPSSNL